MKIDPNRQNIDYAERGFLRMPIATSSGTGTTPTINSAAGAYTKSSSNIAAGDEEAITITNNKIKAGAIVLAMVIGATGGTPGIVSAVVSAGQVIITVTNTHASVATTGYVIGFLAINPE